MISFLRLIRIPNLLIIALTQYLMRYAIIDSILKSYNKNLSAEFHFSLQMSELNFFILVFSVVCLAAAGYVINDYFDTKIDRLNRPKTVIVGNKISRRVAMTLHLILNLIGVIAGLYASWSIGHVKFGLIFLLAAGALWYYSTIYKRQLIVGNVIVSLLAAMIPLMVILFELPLLNKAYSNILIKLDHSFFVIFYWILAFSFFAFITTLVREIIKDIEDFEGDVAYGCNTLPVAFGVRASKIIIIVLLVSILAVISWLFAMFLLSSKLTLWYLIFTQAIPIVLLIIGIAVANKRDDYKKASLLMKVIMIFGLLYSVIAALIFQGII